MEFNNMGMSFGGYEPDQDGFLLEELHVLPQHSPECPCLYQPLDGCTCGYRSNYDVYPSQPVSQSPYQTPVQNPQRTADHRTYAEVAGTAPFTYTSTLIDTTMTDPPTSLGTINYPQPQRSVYDDTQFDLAQTGQKRTYAQVAQYHSRPQHGPSDNGSSQHLHPSAIPQNAGFLHHSEASRVGRTQHRQQSSGMRSRSDRHTNRNLSQTPYQSRYSNNLPQVQEGVPALQQVPSGQPRNVADLIQATTFGGHREPLPSSYLTSYSNNYDEPLSPGSHSVASSSVSRRSSRRKGKAMIDPSLPHACIECQHTFPKLEDLNRHITRTHAHIADRPYRCDAPRCPWAFVNPKDLRRHQRTHSAEQDRYVCPYQVCGKSYTRADNLTRHINRDHVGDSAYLSMSRNGSEMSGSFEQRSGYFDEAFEG